MSNFAPSPQQAKFYDWVETGTGSTVLEAVAGSGKTTTLIHGLSLMDGDVFFGAYNKEIADEIGRKAPNLNNVTISTMHSAGFRAWRRKFPFVKVDGDKCRTIYREASERHPEYRPHEANVLRLASYAKQAGLGIKSPDDLRNPREWLGYVDHYNLDVGDDGILIISLAKKLLEKSNAFCDKVVDYDDMIYAPLFFNSNMYKYDWVLIDEAQDTNATRRELALRMLAPLGRLVAVGDRHQAIYGFTGADANSLELIQKATNASSIPLTVTYRCPKAVVKYAQQWVKHIQAAETAPEGAVQALTDDKPIEKVVAIGDAILCRLSAPLIEIAYGLIADGVPAKIEGREIGNGLKELARRWKVRSYTALRDKLTEYQTKEVEKATKKENSARVQNVEDSVKCLFIIIARAEKKNASPVSAVDAVVAEIDAIFSDVKDSSKVVILSTIHKSKGREWNRVFWAQTGPNRHAKKDWEKEQEANLCYVAATRAKQTLFTFMAKG